MLYVIQQRLLHNYSEARQFNQIQISLPKSVLISGYDGYILKRKKERKKEKLEENQTFLVNV